MPILSADRIGDVRKEIFLFKLRAATLEWVLSFGIVTRQFVITKYGVSHRSQS